GPARAEVPDQPPDVTGLPAGEAESTLLKTWSDKAIVTFIPIGQPPPGADLRLAVVEKQALANADWQKTGEPPRGQLYVGPTVPRLLGLRRVDAADLLTRHGLVLAVEPSPATADWVVVSQSPEPKSRTRWGARVLASFGPPPSVPPVRVPDLHGLTRAEAVEA